jgi:hypothetical protein
MHPVTLFAIEVKAPHAMIGSMAGHPLSRFLSGTLLQRTDAPDLPRCTMCTVGLSASTPR